MKIGEVKIRISNIGINLIDTYFSTNNISDKFINSTLKILLKQNLYKLDSVLSLFSDQNGDINLQEIVNEYSSMIGEDGIIFDLKDYIKNDTLKSFVPDKILVIKQEDILKLLK
jgi:hypothetical protein